MTYSRPERKAGWQGTWALLVWELPAAHPEPSGRALLAAAQDQTQSHPEGKPESPALAAAVPSKGPSSRCQSHLFLKHHHSQVFLNPRDRQLFPPAISSQSRLKASQNRSRISLLPMLTVLQNEAPSLLSGISDGPGERPSSYRPD